jgi:hypothetical protein
MALSSKSASLSSRPHRAMEATPALVISLQREMLQVWRAGQLTAMLASAASSNSAQPLNPKVVTWLGVAKYVPSMCLLKFAMSSQRLGSECSDGGVTCEVVCRCTRDGGRSPSKCRMRGTSAMLR